MEKVLITGTSCGVGRAAAVKFLSEGYEVIGLDIKQPSIVHDNYKHYVCDVSDANSLPEVKGINLKRTKSKKDLLLRAINYDDGETVKELVNNGLNPNIIIKGKSALFLAIDKDKVNSAKALLESGADADAADAGGYTLIDKACRKTDRKVANEIVRLLIKYSNDISDETFNNICKFCDYLTVKTLLESGYTPNSESLYNATRLISSDTALKVELLLNAGANPNERDEHGHTVLFYLSIWDTKEAKEVINVLLEHGANNV